ncbi:MAG: DNA/RNA nuclease SfsA [Planctomycetes bacterium]|nr:DNA/RNA nuclease SfsA [Planctomycetota bacterium]MDP6407963.1 DNA/RNA nuclease SfsA [Planctomycetota bacterium]
MRIEKPILEGRLRRRYKRFLADVELPDGELLTVHCPNPGRLQGCLGDAAEVILRDSEDGNRKLRYTLQTVRVGRHWVNVDTSLPNAVVAEAIEAGAIEELAGYDSLRREVAYGRNSRIDILLEGKSGERCYVEVKCTTLVEHRVAMFPDAVTARGLKHLVELSRMVAEGHRAVMFYFISRADARRFEPADHIDPAYGDGLREAVAAGVEMIAYSASVTPQRLELAAPVKITIP